MGQGLSTLGLALDCCGRSVGPWGQMRWPPAPLAEQHGQDQALGGIGSGHVLLISFKGRQVMGGAGEAGQERVLLGPHAGGIKGSALWGVPRAHPLGSASAAVASHLSVLCKPDSL